MYVEFYKFSKKLNSTAQPDLDPELGLQFWGNHMTLKDGCSILNPVLKIANSADFKPYEYNYAFIRDFGKRYYFVTDYKYVNNMWECYLTVDVMATYKDYICDSTQYVARANVQSYESAKALDTAPLMLGTYTSVKQYADGGLFNADYLDGFYIVGIIAPGATVGSCDYYMFTSTSNFSTFMSVLLSDVDYMSTPEVTNGLMRCLANPMQYIASCRFFPFDPVGLGGTAVSTIKLGFWSISASATKLTTFEMERTFEIEIPKHHQYDSLGYFSNLSPYASYALEFEPFGTMTLDTVKLSYMTELYIDLHIDVISGEAEMVVRGNNSSASVTISDGFISKHFSRICVELPIASNSTSLLGTGMGIIGGIFGDIGAQMVAEHLGNGEIANAISGACSAIAGGSTNVISKGSYNSRVFMLSPPALHAQFQNVDESYVSLLGRSLSTEYNIGALSGFCMVVRARVDFPGAYREESDEIKRLMEGGFYIE